MAKVLRSFKFSAEIGKITFGYTTYQIMSGKEKFKRLKPKLDLLNGKLDTYQLLAAAALQGGKDRTLAKNNCVTEIVEILYDLGDEVEEMSKTDNLAIADSSFQQAKEVKNRVEVSERIYDAVMGFEPIIGHIYYLYEKKDGSDILSMVGPSEWGRKFPFNQFLAKVFLLADHTWKVEFFEEENRNDTIDID